MELFGRLALVLVFASCAARRGDTAWDQARDHQARDQARPVPAAAPVEQRTTNREGDARGFPALEVLADGTSAEGEFTQWVEGDRLHIRIRYVFDDSRTIEERTVLRQAPALVQERWSWLETRAGSVARSFDVDFLAGRATAEVRERDEPEQWSKDVDVEPGRAFAGMAWALAIKSVRARLVDGETVAFQTVGFTPEPKVATVEITHEGLESLAMAGRTLAGERFRIHPKIPWILRLFVEAPDSLMWLTHPPPAAFLRWEGPLAEPSDPLVRVDLLPSEPPGP